MKKYLLFNKAPRLENLLGCGGKAPRILNWILEKYDGELCAGFIWLRIGISDGIL
jgi:hypothetical protein